MNEQTVKLINDLAEKLGTTTEHLWAVLVKQAPIAATCNLIFIGLAALSLVICSKVISRSFNKISEAKYNEQDKWIAITVVSTVIGVFAFMIVLIGLTGFHEILAGLFNPEYWAFKQIVK